LKNLSYAITIIILGFSLIPSSAYAFELNCGWDNFSTFQINGNSDLQKNLGYELVYNFNIQPDEVISCEFPELLDMSNSLVSFSFLINSDEKSDIAFAFIDKSNNAITSFRINEWYDIEQNKKATIFLDPDDFNVSRFHYDGVKSFNIIGQSENIQSVQFSKIFLNSIDDYPSYSIYDNLPVVSPLSGFVLLILISFPAGYLLLNWSGFLKNEQLLIRLPWMLGSGFIVFLIFAWTIANWWISVELIILYIAIEYSALFFYFARNFRKKIDKIHVSSSGIFFLTILIISGIFSITLAETYGWPPDEWDSRAHASITSLIIENHVIPSESYLPISDLSFEPYKITPKGAHSVSASISYLLGYPTITSMASVYFFTMFLVPPFLTYFVYRYTKSIFFASIMFLLSFFKTGLAFWYGDIIFNKWVGGLFPGQIGIFIVIIIFMLSLEIFEKKKNNLRLILPIVISVIGLIVGYYAFIPIILMISIVSIIIYFAKTKKTKIIFLSGTILIFLLMPFWSPTALTLFPLVADYNMAESHWKYLTTEPFVMTSLLLPLWISSAFGLAFSCFLFYKKQYRYFSIVVIIVSLIQLLTISKEITENYLFYIQIHRSLGLMFYFSIVANLLIINHFSKLVYLRLKERSFILTKNKIKIIKVISVIVVVTLLIPSFQTWQYWMNPGFPAQKIPGGNDRNTQLWIFENVSTTDLVLNDIGSAAQWLVGWKAQNTINGWWQSMQVSWNYDSSSGEFIGKTELITSIIESNIILEHPWDYEYIDETLEKHGIDYLYISEKTIISNRCQLAEDSCYPKNQWHWITYSGDARVAMYENHPNLELVIRNGNTALFKVI